MNQEQGGGESLFNRVRMGYLVIASRKTDEWRRILGEGLGMQTETLPGNHVGARMDDHARRILIVPDGAEDLQALGVELADEQALNTVMRRLAARGVKPEQGTAEASELRGVERFWHFTGPKGLEIELFHQPKLVASRPTMATSAFVTGEAGFGHMGLATRRPEAQKEFWGSIFDSRLSDRLNVSVTGVPLRVEFFRFNERHHSYALVYTPGIKLDPIRTRIQHFEVQVATLDDLTNAYERCRKAGIPISIEVGQHGNDRAISFYVRTPSGFDIEYGWNPVAVDEATWQGELWDSISIWGHRFNGGIGETLGQLGHAVGSLFRKEYMPSGF